MPQINKQLDVKHFLFTSNSDMGFAVQRPVDFKDRSNLVVLKKNKIH